MDPILGVLATSDKPITIEGFFNGMPNYLRGFVGPIVVAIGIILIIVGFVQIARYLGGKSNGGGQSRVSILFSIILILFGGACCFGGVSFATQLTSGAKDTISNVASGSGPSNDSTGLNKSN